MTRSQWMGIVAGGILVAGIGAWAFDAAPEVHVDTAQVTAGPISRRVVATGTLQAVTTVEVGTQVSGNVQSLGVDFDSVVHAGQVVARLDPSSYQAVLDQARAGLLEAKGTVDQAQADLAGFRTAEGNARTQLARAKALAAQDLETDADLDAAGIAMEEASANVRAAEAQVKLANATVDQAMASVAQASVNLAHTVIHSPVDGIVVDRDVNVGETMAATNQAPVLFRIATTLTQMQVQVDIDEADVAGLAEGEPATFTVESYPDETFQGTVKQLRLQPVTEETTTQTTVGTSTGSPTTSVVPTVVSYTAIVDVANPDERLRPGMTAEVTLPGAERAHAIRIPNSALGFRPAADVFRAIGEPEPSAPNAARSAHDDGARAIVVWTYDGKRFTPAPIRVGLADDRWTELVSGSIHPGDFLAANAVLRPRSRL